MKNLFCTLFTFLFVTAISAQDRVGTLTAYYARTRVTCPAHWHETFKAGELIIDTNNPFARIVPYNQTFWKFEADWTGEYSSGKIEKAKVIVKKWEMNELPVSLVKNGATFVSKSGHKARIFWANINGHYFCDWDGKEDWQATERFKDGYFVLSAWIKSYDYKSYRLFEQPLREERGNIKLYSYSPCSSNNVKDPRYRPGRIGIIWDEWWHIIDDSENKSAYDSAGRLLRNPRAQDGEIDSINIAYIASENALYIEGELYYKK